MPSVSRRAVLPALLSAVGLLPCAALAAKRGRPKAPPVEPPAIVYARHPAVRQFAADLAERRKLPQFWIEKNLGKARRIEAARRLVMPATSNSAKNWTAYRARFIEPQRIDAGVTFWRDNRQSLHAAEERFGVPPEIVVGIVGVETFYGRIMGSFRLIDVLATLAFDFPTGRSDRSAFFRSELEELFVMCAREGIDPQSLKGSYAGAMGLPQFMPSSVNRHAVDFDGDGRIDLHSNSSDVIGSIANYLASFGWQRGMATHFGVQVPADPAQRAVLLAPDIVPTFSAAQMAERGAVLDAAGSAHTGPLALVELHNGEAAPPTYVAGTQNFYVVTRYNWSSYYALAVIELGQTIQQAR
ncbi:MAG TPA: lytic murein transglycosylase B [Rubrivivax sp.]|nr:lytic murein transglycosylase B [Rubrivivax sp.]